MLRVGKTIKEVAEELGLLPALVKEWYNGMTDTEKLTIETDLEVTKKAVSVVKNVETKDSANAKLELILNTAAYELASKAPYIQGDIEAAKAFNLCADGLAKLYSSFFGKAPNNITIAPSTNSEFSNMLKD